MDEFIPRFVSVCGRVLVWLMFFFSLLRELVVDKIQMEHIFTPFFFGIYIHTYIHTHTHIYIHTYTHTHTYSRKFTVLRGGDKMPMEHIFIQFLFGIYIGKLYKNTYLCNQLVCRISLCYDIVHGSFGSLE